MFFFCFFVIYIFILFNVVFSKLNYQNEQMASAFFESHKNYIVTKEDIIDGIEKCWFNVSEYLINESIKQEKDFSNDIKATINTLKQKLDQLVTVSYSNKKIDTVNASFQWAQSPENIFLNIKFSHRWSSPGALKVKNEEIISNKNHFSFSAFSNDSNSLTKKYIVDLTLLHNIIESETKYNFASVGKVVVTLKKEKKKIWNRLLLSKEKIPNMHVWWDMKEKYHGSIQDFLKEEEKKKKKYLEKKRNEKLENVEKENTTELKVENNKIDENGNNNEEKDTLIENKYENEQRDGKKDDEDGEYKEEYDDDEEENENYEEYEDYEIENDINEMSLNEKDLENTESTKKEDIKKDDEL
ncbi:co-chaperone p23, putative [Plasmodium gallinaceum]|uniref:Co-chaperone p23, putative n=1 Tax=Plasmodium gallinaceum TaxID=5849 RepID=A0A1J1GS88_PLAGA|nr:co-chaperone p23, putative [Plasmodium gallinaceum]CRG95363.1 co-chaperone p23, putative [Plasmodium gallinaceum]